MEHVITSVLMLKYSISAEMEKATELINDFTHHQIHKGNSPVEFYIRPGICEETTRSYITKDNTVIAYQVIILEHTVDKALTDSKYLRLFKANMHKNLRTRFEDSNYDLIQDLKVLDHVILDREDWDE